MFPGSNTNADLNYNKHNQYMAQPPHFLAGAATIPGPGLGVANTLRSTAPVMPHNMQGCIDWAQLAQQWIHMRDSAPAQPLANFSMSMPIAPPPPIIGNTPEYHNNQPELRHQTPKTQTRYEEHGEAEMDMDMDDEENENNGRAIQGVATLPPPPVATQSQWLESSATDMPMTVASNDAAGSGTQPWSNWSSRANPTSHIPSLLKLNVCNPNEPQHLMPPAPQLPQNNNSSANIGSSEIDANKRKMLPAWIREGLEKMEREKQRQLERDQPTTPENDSPAINVKQVSSKSLTTPVNLLNLSSVASDSEDSIAAPEEAKALAMAPQIGNDVLSKTSGSDDEQNNVEEEKHRQSRTQQQDAVGQHNNAVARAANAEAALSGKNYEERLADLMLVVRRTLTEILLETTNEEIAAIASETIKAHRAQASSAQVIRKSALSSITGNLGLAAYGDSSSESGEDDNTDDNDGGQVEDSFDSTAKETSKSAELTADELKARIRKSKRSFEKVIDEIEERVSLQEQMDEQKLQYHRKQELEQTETARNHLPPSSSAELPKDVVTAKATSVTTHEKSHHFNGKRLSRKERTTRFSDNKDGKQSQSYVSQVAAVTAAHSSSSSIVPQKLKPVPNPATNLLQIPESMATMLNAADKALDKAHKTVKKSKTRRRQSSSSSSSSDSSSNSSSSGSNTSSNSSKSSSITDGSSTRSSLVAKKHSSSSHRESRKQRRDAGRKERGTSRHSYRRHQSSRDRERGRDRERERDRDRHALHYTSQHSQRHRRRQKRDSSNSGEEDGSDYRRSSRHSSSRSHHSNSYGKHRERTRSRSNSHSTHNSYSSSSTTHQHRKRH